VISSLLSFFISALLFVQARIITGRQKEQPASQSTRLDWALVPLARTADKSAI